MNQVWHIAVVGCGLLLTCTQPSAFAQGPVTRPEPPAERAEPPGRVRYVIRRAGSGELITPEAAEGTTTDKQSPDLEARHQALEQFRLGNEALRRGQLREAERLFVPLRTNSHFSAQERFQVERICEDLRRRDKRAEVGLPAEARQVVHREQDVPMNLSPSPASDVRRVVAVARQHLQGGEVDQAVARAKEAKLARGVRWGPFEDSPERVLRDAAKVREQQNEKKAADILAEARRLLGQNQFEEAEKLTYQAESLRKEYPFWHRGERHDKLRREIAEKRLAQTKPELPPLPAPAKPLTAAAATGSTMRTTTSATKKAADDPIASSPRQ